MRPHHGAKELVPVSVLIAAAAATDDRSRPRAVAHVAEWTDITEQNGIIDMVESKK